MCWMEDVGKINSLDTTITEPKNSIETAIYRKLATTDCVNP
jgi:hypothetical protein